MMPVAQCPPARRYLPDAQFSEQHEIRLSGSADQILEAILALDDRDDRIVRYMLTLREAPARLACKLGFESTLSGKARLSLSDFTLLEQRSGESLVFGLAGRFWRPGFGLLSVPDVRTFNALCEPGIAKLAMIFSVNMESGGRCSLITHTRIHCADKRALIMFAPYWLMIRLGSGIIRRRILRMIKARMESQATSS